MDMLPILTAILCTSYLSIHHALNTHIIQSYPPHSSHSLASSPVDVEEATGLEQLLERSSIGDKGKSVEGAVVEESGEGQEKAKEGFTHIPIVVTASVSGGIMVWGKNSK